MVPGSVGFQCPNCVVQGTRQTRQRELPYGGTRAANPALTSIVLIVINALVFVAISIAGGAWSTVFNWFALTPLGVCLADGGYYPGVGAEHCIALAENWVDGVATGAWWQPLSSAFTHSAPMHLGFNMLALWFLGPQLEKILGRARFLALYLVSAIVASAFVMWLSDPTTSTIGASGAVFGLMGAVLLVAHRHRGNVRTILMWLGANVVITVVGSAFISWQGHLGGFVGGLATAAAIMYLPKQHRKPWQWVIIGAIAVAALALIAARAMMLAGA